MKNKVGRPPKNGKNGSKMSISLDHDASKIVELIEGGRKSEFISYTIVRFSKLFPDYLNSYRPRLIK